MSFCTVPDSAASGTPCRRADRDVEGEQDDRRRVDRHRGGHAVERDAVEQLLHVVEAVDGHADAADLALRERVVGVVAHLRRQVERDAEAGHALRQQVAVAAVRLRRGPEPGVLPHRPQAAAVHGGLDPAGEGVLAGEAQLGLRVPALERAGSAKGALMSGCRHCVVIVATACRRAGGRAAQDGALCDRRGLCPDHNMLRVQTIDTLKKRRFRMAMRSRCKFFI